MPDRRPRGGAAALLFVVIATVPAILADPALASTGCNAMNQAAADGYYYKGTIALSQLFAGDVIRIRAWYPIEATADNFVPSGFYIGVGQFDAPPSIPIVKFGETLVYTTPRDYPEGVHVTWATTPQNPSGKVIKVTWEVSCTNAPKSNPTLSTQASPSVLLGGPVQDTATLSGGAAPTGTITFKLYGPNDTDCKGPVAFTTSATVNGNGSYTSSGFTPTATGTYRWTAEYGGDGRNNGASSGCGAANESVEVTPFVPPPATSTVTGNANGVTVTKGQSVLVQNAQVAGPITVQEGGALTLLNATVTNGIAATNPSFVSICGSQISAPPGNPTQGIVVVGASAPLRIGDPTAGCAANRVAGDVSITSNSGGGTLGANVVSGNMTVDTNSVGTIVVKGNNVVKTLSCAGNNPTPVNGGVANTAAAKSGQCAGL